MAFSAADFVMTTLCASLLVWIFIAGAINSPMAAFSLPCLTAATSLMYFIYLPFVVLATGDMGYFGIYIENMSWTLLAVLLYAFGASLAFYQYRISLILDPGSVKLLEKATDEKVVNFFWIIAIAGVVSQVLLGKLNIFGSAQYDFASDKIGELAFITQAYNLLIPLSIVFLLKDNFQRRSVIVVTIVLLVFLQAGFRFRIMILLAGAVTAFLIDRNMRISNLLAVIGFFVALTLANLIGAVRRYGQGVDLSALTAPTVGDLISSGGGEFGVVYVLDFTANNPLPDLSPLEPWTIAFVRLIPSFLWPDKPMAQYTRHFLAGTTVENAEYAGIAATQHVEMLLQWGWLGMIPLAYIYFSVACLIITALHRCGRQSRIAGCALVPAFFGYYMQTRGYFFQVFTDGLFMLGPLFLFDKQRKL